MRVYLPAKLADLQDHHGLSARIAYAATRGLRQALPEEDEEGWEFAAFLAAADAAVDADDRSRIVVAADVRDPSDGERVAEVRVPDVAWPQVVSIHIDDLADESARDRLIAARAGDAQAREELGEVDLLWYDVTERAELVALLRHT